ncbi:hypothetical protein FA95DRAFT_902455 [Auriscalpium vulgare]|uniref:Uncharacterized protein n=1 Tax=Auriscalpium vulgare TaxID=40419 RepID=A0ACB8R8N3_9AGAM|nr:hypothetical protein FA95DRAFT_902455 [Auriscalpium vulgare]
MPADTEAFTQEWQLTVCHTPNLKQLRRGKWSPIVTVQVDRHHPCGVVLGADNESHKREYTVALSTVRPDSTLVICVSCQRKGRSKAKRRKKRQLAASASITFAEIQEAQEGARYLEIPLQCVAISGHRNSPERTVNVSLFVRLDCTDPPPTEASSSLLSTGAGPTPTTASVTDLDDDGVEDPWMGVSDGEESVHLQVPSNTLRRRRRGEPQGYRVDSPDIISWSAQIKDKLEEEVRVRRRNSLVEPRRSIIFPLLLPLYIQRGLSPTSLQSFATSVVDQVTVFRELREAQDEAAFEAIRARLVNEWTFEGASLFAVFALGTTVFGFSPDAIFPVNSPAKVAIKISFVSAGVGGGVLSLLWFRYGSCSAQRLRALALDQYQSYLFFALKARVPLLALAVSIFAFVAFATALIWPAKPLAYLVIFGAIAGVFSVQYIIYYTGRLLRAVWKGMIAVVRWLGLVRPPVNMPTPMAPLPAQPQPPHPVYVYAPPPPPFFQRPPLAQQAPPFPIPVPVP